MESELYKKIERIKAFINTDKILKGDKNSIGRIRFYYFINRPAYRRFHSDRGFMHFRVSMSGKIEEHDAFYQPDTVSKLTPQGGKVVELGSGQGANIFYLCKKRPDASFVGTDLTPPKMPKPRPVNLRLLRCDYGNMSEVESGSADVVFGIETVVHCSDKDRVFSEVNRVLKKGGLFVLYDYATVKPFDENEPLAKLAIDLISKCGACARIEGDEEWEEHFEKNGFEKVSKTDYGKQILPDLERLERSARRVMDKDGRLKWVFRLFPRTFTNNILIGYLGADAFKEGIFYYNEWIYRKK